ncbi:hypothetical protein B0H21DRAFT_819253 [Amylocystis lapponica]|nr:hypothetical protein B0H21DRAFT_819253 [Amylocystis lapponica]
MPIHNPPAPSSSSPRAPAKRKNNAHLQSKANTAAVVHGQGSKRAARRARIDRRNRSPEGGVPGAGPWVTPTPQRRRASRALRAKRGSTTWLARPKARGPTSSGARRRPTKRAPRTQAGFWGQRTTIGRERTGGQHGVARSDALRRSKSVGETGLVDRQKDVIPFWRKGVDAADRGEEAEKWEHFLEELEEKYNKGVSGWGLGSDGWGRDHGEGVWGYGEIAAHGASQPGNAPYGEGDAAWGLPACAPAAVDSSKRRRRRKNRNYGGNSWTFVEEVAKQEDATAERRRRMHEFYDMPTHQKVQQIQKIIHLLQVQAY